MSLPQQGLQPRPTSAWPARRPEVLSVADCPSRVPLDQIANKWSVLILAALCDEPLRFNAIRRLSPVAVEYGITPLGRSLRKPFETLHAWTLEHLAEVEDARRAFDALAAADVSAPGIDP